MGLLTRAAALAQQTAVKFGNILVEAGVKYSRPDAISALVGAADGRVQRNQSGDRILISPKTMRRMAMYDPVLWSIINCFKTRLTKMQWSVGADVERQIQELNRLEKLAAGWLSPYAPTSWKPDFSSNILPSGMAEQMWKELEPLRKGVTPAGSKPKAAPPSGSSNRDARMRARWLFDQAQVSLETSKAGPAAEAENFLKTINKDNNEPFKHVLSRVIDDLCTMDAGAVAKVRTRGGGILEAYDIPAEEIIRYRNPDLSTPQPPYRAYRWERNGFFMADYTTEDMMYLVKNPQTNGYGFSPLEAAVNIITASLYADTYNMDIFRSNIPPAIMDLGPITDAQRIRFRAEWENELHRGGQHRIMFVNPTKGGQMALHPMEGLTQKEMQYMEYIKWTLMVKCMCFRLSPQDIGYTVDLHRTTAEVQQKISTEGILDMADFLEKQITAALILPFFGEGLVFKFTRDGNVMSLDQAQMHEVYLKNGVLTTNQVLKAIGQRPLPDGGDEPFIMTRTDIVPVSEIFSNDSSITLDADPGEGTAAEGIVQSGGGAVQQKGQGGSPDAAANAQKALEKMRGGEEHIRAAVRESMALAKKNRNQHIARFKDRIGSAANKSKKNIERLLAAFEDDKK